MTSKTISEHMIQIMVLKIRSEAFQSNLAIHLLQVSQIIKENYS